MLELCELLDISVNDLLNGEILSAEDYNRKTAAQLVEAIRQKEAVEDRLLSIKTMLDILSILFTVPAAIVFFFIPTDNAWLLAILLFLYVLAVFGFRRICLKVDHLVGFYQCPHCDHIHKPTREDLGMSFGFGRKRKLKCPSCGKEAWQIKVITKE